MPPVLPREYHRRVLITAPVSGEYSMRQSSARHGRVSAFARALAVLSLLATAAFALPGSAAAASAEIGYRDASYAGAHANTPTKNSTQHKLWFNDGTWWGALFDPTSTEFHIWKLDRQTQEWSDTGTALDGRDGAHVDVLWTGSKLYEVGATPSGAPVVRRYSYDSGSNTYSLDSGFPVTISEVGTKPLGTLSVSIAKDSAGVLWIGYMQAQGSSPSETWKAAVAHSAAGDETSWTAAYELPGQSGAGIGAASGGTDGQDVAQIVAFGSGAGSRVGVFWSHVPSDGTSGSANNGFYFSSRADSNGTLDVTSWTATPESALTGAYTADNHVSVTTDENDNVLALVKTNRDKDPGPNGNDPLVTILSRSSGGAWSRHDVFKVSTKSKPTRPYLVIDSSAHTANVFYTAPESATSTANPATIYLTSAPLSTLAFSGPGSAVIKNSNQDWNLNDTSSTAQRVTSTSGWVALAEDSTSKRYLHACGGAACPKITTGATYTAITPVRLLDTRTGNGLSGKFSSGDARTFNVGGRSGIPSGAVAVTGNLTVTGQTSRGHVALGPIATDTPLTSTINFPKGDNRANNVTVKLGSGGTLSATFVGANGSDKAHLLFDVTGYFTNDTSGATFSALTPARILDSRSSQGAGTFHSKVHQSFQVTGEGGVPGNAVAVTGNLTVTNQTSRGHIAVGPTTPDGEPATSTLNFPKGDNRANGVTVDLDGTGKLSATFVGATSSDTANLLFDVTGYFTDDLSGATFTPLTPSRILDSRTGLGVPDSFVTKVHQTFQVTGEGGVPDNAVAVTGNLTVTGQTAKGHAAIGPDPEDGEPATSTLNFPEGDNRANGVAVALGTGGTLSATYVGTRAGSKTDLLFDVGGVYTP
ncbi:MAG TPA: hypothetical protein VFS32_10085 [Candidatus Limnocylindrales bacterium]|nr:hypothetical protein [Candidatus Limnocylindrales bacterium]